MNNSRKKQLAAGNAAAKVTAEKQNFPKFCFLSIITLGIYGIFYMIKFTETVNTVLDGDGETTGKYGKVFLLSLATLGVYGIIWHSKLMKRIRLSGDRLLKVRIPRGDNEDFIVALGVLAYPMLGIPMLYAKYIIFKNLNSCIDKFNKRSV